MTRVAVMGAGGATGLLSAVLGEDPDIEVVRIQGSVAERLAGDLIIGPWVENPAEARDGALAAIKAGVPYLSPSSSVEVVEALLELDQQARAAGTLVVAGVGWSPGITNLAVKQAFVELDTARRVEIDWVASPAGSMSQAALSRALGLLVGEASVYRKGALSSSRAGTMPQNRFFPEPVGWRTLRLARAAEMLTLPASMEGLQDMVVRGGLTDGLVEVVLRSSSRIPVARTAGSRAASDKLLAAAGRLKRSNYPWSALRVDVAGETGGSERTLTYGLVDQLPNLLVAPLVVAVQTLAEKAPWTTGSLPTEAVFDPEDFFRRLAYRGVRLASLQRTP